MDESKINHSLNQDQSKISYRGSDYGLSSVNLPEKKNNYNE